MKVDFKTSSESRNSLRYGLLVPIALMIGAVIMSCQAYSNAKKEIADDLNNAMIALANKNSELWTRQDTIAALRQMHETTHKPLIFQASDAEFRNAALKDEVYYTLTLIDKKNAAQKIRGHKIASDSIMLLPEKRAEEVAVCVQGYADCSMASVFGASDQTMPSLLFSLAILSMGGMLVWRRKKEYQELCQVVPSVEGIKLTPMQRQLTQMLLDSPDRKVDKAILCAALWGSKMNAEESLYTLVKRTKAALAEANFEIICNRGESYELRIKP